MDGVFLKVAPHAKKPPTSPPRSESSGEDLEEGTETPNEGGTLRVSLAEAQGLNERLANGRLEE